jgi:hypothetical protein
MRTTPEALATIRKLRIEKKFDAVRFYAGAPDEDIRLRCEESINRFADEILALLEREASRDEILSRAKETLDSFSEEDTEEYERAGDYVEELMRAIGIEERTDFILNHDDAD